MAIKARMKFRGDIRYDLEHKLITKFGFRVFSRLHREWIIVEKVKSNFQPEVLTNGELDEETQKTLTKRCITIVNHFSDPDKSEYMIRVRIMNMANTLPPFQKKFVHDWIALNIGEE